MKRIFVLVFVVVSFLAADSSAQRTCSRCGGVVRSQQYGQSAGVVRQWGSGQKLQVAIASAQYRAARGIRGHCHIERGHRAGVGWSTGNPTPATCYWNQRNRGAYASVRGRNGHFYSTLIL